MRQFLGTYLNRDITEEEAMVTVYSNGNLPRFKGYFAGTAAVKRNSLLLGVVT